MGEDALSLARIFSGIFATRATSETIAGESVAYRIGNAVLGEMQNRGFRVTRSNADEVARAAAQMVAFVLDMTRDVQAAVDKLVKMAENREFIRGVYLVASESPPASAVVMLPVPEERWLETTEAIANWASKLSQSSPGVDELVHNARAVTLAEWESTREQSEIVPLWERAQNTCRR